MSKAEGISEYEVERLERIKENKKLVCYNRQLFLPGVIHYPARS